MARSIIGLSIQKNPPLRWILFIFVLGLFVAMIFALTSNSAWEASVPYVDPNLGSSSSVFNGDKDHHDNAAEPMTTHDDDPHRHVIIIGAGAAGLSAAYTLDYLNINYTLLEADGQIGGRTKPVPTDAFSIDVPLDAGAEWIHVHPKILADLLLYEEDQDAVKRNVRTIRYRPHSFGIYARHRQRRRDFVRHFYQENKFYNTTWFSYFENYMYPYIADRTVTGAIVNKVDIREEATTTTTTTTASSSETVVRISTTDGRDYDGSHVIVAVPVAMLQRRSIAFQPILPRHQWNAIDDADMTYGIKVFLEFEQQYYPDFQMSGRIFGFFLDSEEMYFDSVYRKPSTRNVLTMFNVGRHARKYEYMNDDEIISMVLLSLNHIFGNEDASTYFLQGHVEQWTTKPFIRGAYTINDVDEGKIGKPLADSNNQNRVYFAGEHLGGAHQATVHGAAISGRKAVLRLLHDNRQTQ